MQIVYALVAVLLQGIGEVPHTVVLRASPGISVEQCQNRDAPLIEKKYLEDKRVRAVKITCVKVELDDAI